VRLGKGRGGGFELTWCEGGELYRGGHLKPKGVRGAQKRGFNSRGDNSQSQGRLRNAQKMLAIEEARKLEGEKTWGKKESTRGERLWIGV